MFSLDGKEILPKYIYAPENEYARYFQRNVMERMVVDLSLFVIDSCKDLKAFPEIINYKKFVS